MHINTSFGIGPDPFRNMAESDRFIGIVDIHRKLTIRRSSWLGSLIIRMQSGR